MTYKFFRFYSTAFLSFLLVVSILALQIQPVDASSKSPHDSGYDHGCDDADISDPDDRYINQPEKGPSFHTIEFMRGYNAGYDACSNDGGSRDSSESSGRSIGGSGDSGSGYSVTVRIGDHPFGNQWSYVWVETEDGYNDNVRLATAGNPLYTFNIPPGYGDNVKVCASSAVLAPSNCQTFSAGEDVSVTLDVEALLD